MGVVITVKSKSEGVAIGAVVAQLLSSTDILSFGSNLKSSALPDDSFWSFMSGFEVFSNDYALIETVELDSKELQPVMMQGDTEIQVLNQFDGKASGFGKKAWTKLANSHAGVKSRLASDIGISKITYSDVYVCSPITFLLFAQIIEGLKQAVSNWDNPTIYLTTGLKSPNDKARGFYSEWRNQDVQEEVFIDFFQYRMKEKLEIELKDKRDMAHDRTLSIHWDNGEVTSIRFDQGMGSWSVHGKNDQWFDQNSHPRKHVEFLLKALTSMKVINSKGFPTPIVIRQQ